MDIGLVHSVWTVLVVISFIGIVVWAWSGKRKQEFETAARAALEDGDEEAAPGPTQEGAQRHG